MYRPILQYFTLPEFVCPHVSKAFGSRAWTFIDDRLLETAYVIRNSIGLPMVVNDWATGGNFSQRGLRCNVCALVKEKTALEKVYMTAHTQGEALDFHIKGMTANEVRLWIVRNQVLLPYPIRLEVGFSPHCLSEEQLRTAIMADTMNWVHLDLRGEGQKITYFQG